MWVCGLVGVFGGVCGDDLVAKADADFVDADVVAGAQRVFVDRGESSRVKDRPQWVACLDYLRPGDTLLVRRLDHIAGSERKGHGDEDFRSRAARPPAVRQQ